MFSVFYFLKLSACIGDFNLEAFLKNICHSNNVRKELSIVIVCTSLKSLQVLSLNLEKSLILNKALEITFFVSI